MSNDVGIVLIVNTLLWINILVWSVVCINMFDDVEEEVISIDVPTRVEHLLLRLLVPVQLPMAPATRKQPGKN